MKDTNDTQEGAYCDPNPEPCDCSDIGWVKHGGGDGEQVIGRIWKLDFWGDCCEYSGWIHLFGKYYWKRKE